MTVLVASLVESDRLLAVKLLDAAGAAPELLAVRKHVDVGARRAVLVRLPYAVDVALIDLARPVRDALGSE